MSDIDLTAAIEKAVDVLHDWNWDPEFPPENEQNDRDAHRATAANLLPHIAPLIESAVREQIARDIEALTEALGLGEDYGARAYNRGLEDAARIARGES